MATYFIISSGEDGIEVEQMSKQTLLERIAPEEGEDTNYYDEDKFLKSVPNTTNGHFDEGGLLIIKGEVIVPKVKEKVTKFEID